VSAHFPVVIHHNTDCGTSRNVLELIRAAGYEPTIVPYLETDDATAASGAIRSGRI
jgi:arsenate reductase-like glutaredoxin family protein